jgi:dTDP-4-amino-4,6-dideoxygalactose transaminase
VARYQLPAWSPVPLGAIGRGLAALGSADASRSLASELEREFLARRALLAGSGTIALMLALRGAPAGRGRPSVLLPAYSCYDLATACDGADAVVALYDVDPLTLGPDADSLRRTVRAMGGVDAVVLAHLYGVPVAVDLVREAAGDGPLVIDDAAQGCGATLDGRPLGSHGDIGVLSFGRGKGRTGGGGGALLAATDRGVGLLERAAAGLPASEGGMGVREAAGLLALWLLGRPSLYALPASLPSLRLGETIYRPPPTPRAMTGFAAGVLLASTRAVAREAARRREAGQWWSRALQGVAAVERIVPPASSVPGWLRFPLLARPDLVGAFREPRFRRLGVMPGYPTPLGELPGFRGRLDPRGESAWPGAAVLSRRLFTLPTHGRVTERDRETLLGLIRSVG